MGHPLPHLGGGHQHTPKGVIGEILKGIPTNPQLRYDVDMEHDMENDDIVVQVAKNWALDSRMGMTMSKMKCK